jgi:hypothetical protein
MSVAFPVGVVVLTMVISCKGIEIVGADSKLSPRAD